MAVPSLQLPSYAAPQSLDFTPLSKLGDLYRQSQQRAARERALAGLQAGPDGTMDYAGAARALLGAGDTEGGLSLAKLAETQADRAFDRSYKTQSLDLQRQIAQRREEPEDVRKLRAAGISPDTPEGRKALFPKTDTPISATDKKAVMEAEDTVPQIQGTIENLSRALELNPKTMSGYTAGLRADIGTKLPGGGMLVDKNAALATSEWQKIMGPEALQAMASTLKGATTDFELRKFIEMLGDPATDPKIRAGVINRMKTLAERKLEIQNRRVRELRSGEYYKPPQAGGQSTPSGGITKEQYDALPPGTPYTAPDGTQRVKR